MAGRAAGINIELGNPAPRRERDQRTGPSHDGGVSLRAYVLERYKYGHMTAKDVCSICYFAEKAGAAGISDLSLPPENTHHTEHVMKSVNARAQEALET